MDQRRLAIPQTPEFEEAVVGRPERHGDAGGLVRRDPVGDSPGERRRHGPSLGVRAVDPDRHRAVPHREARHVGAHLGDGARALVAHDVGHRVELPAEAAEGVATLDADGLDVDEDVARTSDGVGHLLVAENIRRPRFVIDRCSHTRSYSFIRKCFVRFAYHRDVWGSWVAILPLAFLK